jgi:c-di-GMP-binding flagellar brake protein YcgR
VSDEIIQESSTPVPAVSLRPDGVDRRSAFRFPIEQDVRYRVLNRSGIEAGSGKTVNISSNGVLFTTERTLAPEARVEVAMNWPVRLDNSLPLKLVIIGRVVRSEGSRAAITIRRYEFRTQGSYGLQ